MKDRATPRNIPDTPLYWKVDVPSQGAVTFRTPFPLTTAKILKEMETLGLSSFREEVGTIDLEKMDQAIELWLLSGAAVGIAWHDETRDLESDRAKYKDIKEYGEAVLEELHEAGWEMTDFRVLFPAVFKALTLSMLSVSEVRARSDFSERKADVSN